MYVKQGAPIGEARMNKVGLTSSALNVRQAARGRRTGLAQRQNVGFYFVLPAAAFTFVFFVLPLGMTIFMSLHDWPLLGAHSFIGLDNYTRLLSDKQFWSSLWFTTRYTLLITPIIFILAFLLALLVNLPLRFVGFFRTAFFMPV